MKNCAEDFTLPKVNHDLHQCVIVSLVYVFNCTHMSMAFLIFIVSFQIVRQMEKENADVAVVIEFHLSILTSS